MIIPHFKDSCKLIKKKERYFDPKWLIQMIIHLLLRLNFNLHDFMVLGLSLKPTASVLVGLLVCTKRFLACPRE